MDNAFKSSINTFYIKVNSFFSSVINSIISFFDRFPRIQEAFSFYIHDEMEISFKVHKKYRDSGCGDIGAALPPAPPSRNKYPCRGDALKIGKNLDRFTI